MHTSIAVAAAPTVDNRRVVFLDVARVAATLMMVQGHTVDALLSPEYRDTAGFQVWTSIRGLTPSTFLFTAGFAFALVTWRADAAPLRRSATWRRLRRWALFLGLGYVLHAPAGNLAGWLTAEPGQWRTFQAVDILQCVAATLTLLQLLALCTRTVRRFVVAAVAMTAGLCAVTPWTWNAAHDVQWPAFAAAYLSPATGSLFPLLPWSAYAALGAVMGGLYRSAAVPRPAAWTTHVMLPVGGMLYASAIAVRAFASEAPIGGGRPSQFLLQAGLVCMILTAISVAVDRVPRQRAGVGIIARESLTVYFVHVCLVYGSPWSLGLRQIVGETLTPAEVLVVVLAMWSAMGLLVIAWGRCKQTRPGTATRIRYLTAGTLVAGLLF
jgi:uncharacterized membrane protein